MGALGGVWARLTLLIYAENGWSGSASAMSPERVNNLNFQSVHQTNCNRISEGGSRTQSFQSLWSKPPNTPQWAAIWRTTGKGPSIPRGLWRVLFHPNLTAGGVGVSRALGQAQAPLFLPRAAVFFSFPRAGVSSVRAQSTHTPSSLG